MPEQQGPPPVDTLWTSGWDSTFRIADLLLVRNERVRPWYVVDPNRRSSTKELETMQLIRSALLAKDGGVADRLLPLEVRHRERIPTDDKLTERYVRLQRRASFGSQYDWLARLAASEGLTLEMGLKFDDRPSAHLRAVVSQSGDIGRFALTDRSDDDLLLFERFRFPLFDLTKADMGQLAQDGGFADLLELTWFCHSPLLSGTACGCCGPCRHAREEGFGRRVPAPTRARRAQHWGLEKSGSARRLARAAFGVPTSTGRRGT